MAPKKEPKGKTNNINLSNPKILTIKKISEIKFIEGGAAILAALSMNKNKVNKGKINNIPLFT